MPIIRAAMSQVAKGLDLAQASADSVRGVRNSSRFSSAGSPDRQFHTIVTQGVYLGQIFQFPFVGGGKRGRLGEAQCSVHANLSWIRLQSI